MEKKTLVPKTANTFNKICRLKQDNVSTRKSWIMLSHGSKLTIYNQRRGEGTTGQVTLTYKEFERFVKFYETGL